jgi:hypothetical protein
VITDRRHIIDLLDCFVGDTREFEAYARWLYIRAEKSIQCAPLLAAGLRRSRCPYRT